MAVKRISTKRGTRHVKVLASGKYKFISKAAYDRAKGNKKSSSTKKNKPKTKRKRGNYMARRKKKGKKKSFTIPVAVVGGFVGAPGIRNGVTQLLQGNFNNAMNDFGTVAGVKGGRFNAQTLANNVLPIAAGILVHKLIGGKLGVNRALGQAGIPILRI